MDSLTQDSGSTSPNGDEVTPSPTAIVASIEVLGTAEQSRRALALVELAELQNELGLTE
jgi:hypothetical protein